MRVAGAKLQCRDLVALTGEARDRLLIYYNGYLDGQHGETTWDERIVGQRLEEALRHCRDDPAATVQHAFTKAWSR
jgi:HdeA/HdeB family protein